MQLWTAQPIAAGVTVSTSFPTPPAGREADIPLAFTSVPASGTVSTLDIDLIGASSGSVLARWGRLQRTSVVAGLVITLPLRGYVLNGQLARLRLTATPDWLSPVLVTATRSDIVLSPAPSPMAPVPPFAPRGRRRSTWVAYPSGLYKRLDT